MELTEPCVLGAGCKILLCLTADFTANPPAQRSQSRVGMERPRPHTLPTGHSLPSPMCDGGHDMEMFAFAGVCSPQSYTSKPIQPHGTVPAHLQPHATPPSPWEMLNAQRRNQTERIQ